MQNSDPLVPLGWAIIVSTLVAIIVPLVRRRSDALTAWNFMLLGGAMFMGVGCLAVKYGIFHWPELQWFQPQKDDVQIFVVGAIAFYATLFVSYYYLSLPRKIAGRVFNKWPPMTASLVFLLLAFCIVVSLAATVAPRIPIVSAILLNVSHKALVFSVVISFCYWYRNRRQTLLLFVFLAVFAFAAVDAMVLYVGRRLLLSIVAAPLICMYWLNWRYRPIKSNLFRVGVASLIALSAAAFYSTFRHFNLPASYSEGRSFATTIGAMKDTSIQKTVNVVTQDVLTYFSQYCTHYSLLTIQLTNTGQVAVEPLHSLWYVVSYPVPRLLWSAKPKPLSGRIVKEVLRMRSGRNWGLGIVASGYQQGGVLVTMLYAFLLVVLVRVLDDPLARRPDNVFLLAALCAAAPHFVAWIRGECGVMTTEIGETILFAWGLGLVGRIMFGTESATSNSGAQSHALQQQGGQLTHAVR